MGDTVLITFTKCRSPNTTVAQSKNCPFAVNTTIELKNVTATSYENCALMGYYTAWNGISVPTFRDTLSAPSSRVGRWYRYICPETSVRNYHYSLRNNPKVSSSHLLRGGSLKSIIGLVIRCLTLLEDP